MHNRASVGGISGTHFGECIFFGTKQCVFLTKNPTFFTPVIKIERFWGRRKTRNQSAWAREVLFSVQVRFEMPKIASCSRAAAPQCAPLRGYTSVHFREFRFFGGSGTQSEAWGSCGAVSLSRLVQLGLFQLEGSKLLHVAHACHYRIYSFTKQHPLHRRCLVP